jgi:WD40 repeat protein
VFSPDGRRLVTKAKKIVRIWDTETGQPVSDPLTHPAMVKCVTFSPDGKRIAAGGDESTIRVWHADTGRPAPAPQTPKSFNRIVVLTFSPDGTKLASAADSEARVWNVGTGEPVTPEFSHKKTITAVQFSPDGTRLLTANWDNTARVWDAATGKPVGQALSHDKPITNAVFSPDGKRVATASGDDTVRVWDAGSGSPVTPPLKSPSAIGVAFDPSGTRLGTACYARHGHIWDIEKATQICTLQNKYFDLLTRVCFSPDGRRVALYIPNGVVICDARTGEQLYRATY